MVEHRKAQRKHPDRKTRRNAEDTCITYDAYATHRKGTHTAAVHRIT